MDKKLPPLNQIQLSLWCVLALIGAYALVGAVLLHAYNSMGESECQAHFLLTYISPVAPGGQSAVRYTPGLLVNVQAFSVAFLPVVCYSYSILGQTGMEIVEGSSADKNDKKLRINSITVGTIICSIFLGGIAPILAMFILNLVWPKYSKYFFDGLSADLVCLSPGIIFCGILAIIILELSGETKQGIIIGLLLGPMITLIIWILYIYLWTLVGW